MCLHDYVIHGRGRTLVTSVATALNSPSTPVPTNPEATSIDNAIKVAIKAYSIAVTPSSSFKNVILLLFNFPSDFHFGDTLSTPI